MLFAAHHQAAAQNSPEISTDELIYNFGSIGESDGPASHLFVIRNAGNGPLVITRVTASCGCTQPEWSKEPIAPGKDGEVKVTYNPKGRPGPFYKTISIFSNVKKGSYTLAIKGNVTPKPVQPLFTFPYAIGELKLTTKTILYSSIRSNESLGEQIMVINNGKTPLTIHSAKLPHWLTADIHPMQLKPGEIGEINLLLNAEAVKRKGRVTAELGLSIQNEGGKAVSGQIQIAANIIDDFSTLTVADKSKAPIAELSGTLLDFGKLPKRGGIIPLIGGKVTGEVTITNAGKSPLILHSVTCDNPLLDISCGKKVLKPGASAVFKISVRPKGVKAKLEALINIVCNDPIGPVRLVKVTAER
ncbi:MAG: DUF1573 domain-containing protein [Tannerellaceae bacterium]